MRIKLLPSSAGRQSQFQSLTSFIVDDRLAIDGGSLGFALTPSEIGAIRHVVVTHAHSDHTASLPIYIAEAFPVLDGPISIYASGEVIATLRQHVFNDNVWPNFENIRLRNGSGATIEFRELRAAETITISGIEVTPVWVNHIVPTFGLLLRNEATAVLFSSDTYITDEIWKLGRETERLRAVFVDVSYPNEMSELAAASRHLTPELLAAELRKLNRDVEVYAVHIKPSTRDDVIKQLAALNDSRVGVAEIARVYEW